MTRPQARKSSLAGSTPLRATEESNIAAKKAWRHKVSFYQDPAETDRVRGAILHTMLTENMLAAASGPGCSLNSSP